MFNLKAHPMKNHITSLLSSFAVAWLLAVTPALAQDQNEDVLNRESYLMPPDHIANQVLAPRHQNITLSNVNPTGEYFLNTESLGSQRLSDLARDHYNIAGLQFDPAADRHRFFTTTTTIGLETIDWQTMEHITIDTPGDARVSGTSWSPDGQQIAFMAHYANESHIYVADVATGESQRVTDRPLLATEVTGFDWAGDSNHLFAVTVPANRPAPPQRPSEPITPKVRTTTEEDNRLRTYPSLLEDPHEQDLLEYYLRGQLVRINTTTGVNEAIGEPDLLRSIDGAPDGEHVRITRYDTDLFSYIVPLSRFGYHEEIWDLDGQVLAELRSRKPREGVEGEDTWEDHGRSNIAWRPDGQGLSMIVSPEDEEEEDNGPENGEADNDEEENDVTARVEQWLPPFDEDNRHVVYESERDIQSVRYSNQTGLLFITERPGGDEHLYVVDPQDPEEQFTIYRYDRDDFYADPGNLSTRPGELGPSVVRMPEDAAHVYLSGTQYHEDPEEDAPQPFVDRVEIETGETERLFQSSTDTYEQVAAILDDELEQLVLERESPDMHPDSWLYDRQTDELTQLTENTDFNREVTSASRERIEIERADGLTMMGDVILPPDYEEGEEYPALIWHYPREYSDKDSYHDSRRWHNKNSFPGVGTRSPEILVTQGYVVIRPDWPIVATRGTENDNFVRDIVQNVTATIDAVDELGVIDRDRLAIGGHSYGAFGTANAMIHTSFFRAGIAGNGNYNRTLTPLGFQRESSDLWRARERYVSMSPIFYAERMDGALLMYHGDEDQNVGTWPMNSERMLHALNGIGKEAAMYMYPHEGHGPSAEQTLLDMWTRWVGWLDHYVKDKGEGEPDMQLAGEGEEEE